MRFPTAHVTRLSIPHSHSCEGNLINSLDNSNPTRMLLHAIETAGIRNVKEDDFYLTLAQGGHVWVVSANEYFVC